LSAVLPPPVPTSEPTTLTAGDTWQWTVTLPAYPPSAGWTLHYAIRGAAPVDVTATPDGADGYAIAVPAARSAALPGGRYPWAAFVTNAAGERVTVREGAVTIRPNLAGPSGDQRSHAERMLAAIEGLLQGRVTRDVESYTINGRSLVHLPIAELERLRARYAAEVRQQRRPGRFGRTIGVRFGRA